MKLVDVPEKHLPDDFAERLVRLVRRRRRARRLRAVALVAAVAVLGAGLSCCCLCHREETSPTETRLVAAPTSHTNETQISGLMLLSLFRECFRRTRTNKKKEEE